MHYFSLLIVVLTVFSCRSTASKHSGAGLLAVSSSTVKFQKPDCIPNCTAEDQAKLMASSEIERAYILAIQSAKTSVEFSQFTFSRKPIFDALVAAAERGVRIRGIVDRAQLKTTGAFCSATGCQLPSPFSDAPYVSAPIAVRLNTIQNEVVFKNGTMSDKLVLLLSSLPSGSGVKSAPGKERLVHNKFAIIDKSHLLTGSGNWSSTAISVNLENLTQFSAPAAGDIVQSLSCMFDLVWTGDSNAISQNLPTCQIIDKIYFSPSSRLGSGPQDAIIVAIDKSMSTIEIAMHHLVDPDVVQRLIAARQRGIKVRVAVDDDDCNMKDDILSKLEGAGAEVKYVPTNCKIFQLSHNKYGVFDRKTVINGSGNWSKSGLGRNYENFIRGADFAPDFSDHFDWLWSIGVPKSSCQCDTSTQACIQSYCLNQQF